MSRADLQQRIGYQFNDQALFQRALTHRSSSGEHMERLEFLGDAVVGLVIAEYLHQHFLDATEGEMSRMRAAVVCKEGLLKVAHLWKLKDEVMVGLGERSSSGAPKSQSVVANAVEALIGAVFLEAGLDQVRTLILKAWHQMLNSMDDLILHDPKSRLQEYTQGKTWGLPIYEI
ncbi:MAG: ribonuclease III, partial [Mariprofundaceae bacterium]